MRIDRISWLMAKALITALRSTCCRRQVGAIIVQDGRTISDGYAGAPAGLPHCLDVGCDTSAGNGCQRTSHAEINAISYAARKGVKTEGGELYCTLSPCKTCAKAIINAGIIRVYYHEEYRDPEGINLLRKAGIECIHHNVVSVRVTSQQLPSVSHQSSTEPGETPS